MRTLILVALLSVAGCAHVDRHVPTAPPALPLVPQPEHVEHRGRGFTLRDGGTWSLRSPDGEAASIARRFVDRLGSARGIHLVAAQPAARADVVFVLDPEADAPTAAEGYRLEVGVGGIEVAARSREGLFRAATSLWQLLTPRMSHVDAIDVEALRVVDVPRFRWRGAMLDSARHFQPPAFVKRFIDELADLKLNVLHWHLTDDQGWRIEIKRHPRLTGTGAWRRPAGAAGTEASGQAVRYGGYYTQDEIRDIVAYAAARYVTIVPEVDMPGHMQAAIAAYPELGSAGDTPVVSPDWGVHGYLLNVDESTIAFMQDVLDEVVDLFPSKIIHVGGDEAVKDQWKASARVQARMHALGIADETHLQAWFIARMQAHLASRGRRLIGWDEILEGALPADAAVMSWRGSKGGIEAAKKGHDVVMSPSPDLYFDHLQGVGDDEPSGRPDLRTLADIYAFDPLAGIDAASAAHVLGAQANLWTEHMRTTAMVEHAAFPRLAALAEVLWSPPRVHGWDGFIVRLLPQMARWRANGIAAADSAFAVRIARGASGLTLSNQADLPMRYTTDGSAPTSASPVYANPLALAQQATLRAATFHGSDRIGDVAVQEPGDAWHLASPALKQCSGHLVLRLEDDAPSQGARAFFDVDLFDPCWLYPGVPLDAVHRLHITVGQLPYNFQLQKDAANIVPRAKARMSAGELVVSGDGCDGAELARVPLQMAAMNPATSVLDVPLRGSGTRDLCFTFAYDGVQPLWAIRDVKLVPDQDAQR